MATARPRKHHYLPQFYLKNFSANGTHIFQATKGSAKRSGGRIADTAAIRDFHTLDFDGCPDPEALEKLVSVFESEIAPALASVIETESINDSARKKIDILVSMLQSRVPARKKMIEAGLMESVRSVGKLMQENGKLPPIPEGLEDQLSFENIIIEVKNWKTAHEMFMHAFDSDVLSVLGHAHATLIKAEGTSTFLTGDQPVSLYNVAARPEDRSGRGIADPHSVITLPLSSTLAVQLSCKQRSTSKLVLANQQDVDEINRRTVTTSTERLFAQAFDNRLEAVMFRYAHCNAGGRMDVVRSGDAAYHLFREVPVMNARLYEPLGATNAFVPLSQRPVDLQTGTSESFPIFTRYLKV